MYNKCIQNLLSGHSSSHGYVRQVLVTSENSVFMKQSRNIDIATDTAASNFADKTYL
jgi:hypothetical protein